MVDGIKSEILPPQGALSTRATSLITTSAALGVGAAICSAVVTDVAAAFHEEHLELQPSEIEFFRRTVGDDGVLEEMD